MATKKSIPETTSTLPLTGKPEKNGENSSTSSWKINWVEVLVVGIILATLAWLSVTVFSMNGTLAKVEAQTNNSKEDIARIRGVLPDLGKAIAQTEVQAPLNAAMVTSKPFKNQKGELVKTFKVIDTKESEILTYTVNLKDFQDNEKTMLFNGAVHSIEQSPVSFSKLIDYSNQTGQPVTLSSNIDLNNSFVIGNLDTMNYRIILNSYFGNPAKRKIYTQAENWLELSAEFKNNKDWLKNAQ